MKIKTNVKAGASVGIKCDGAKTMGKVAGYPCH